MTKRLLLFCCPFILLTACAPSAPPGPEDHVFSGGRYFYVPEAFLEAFPPKNYQLFSTASGWDNMEEIEADKVHGFDPQFQGGGRGMRIPDGGGLYIADRRRQRVHILDSETLEERDYINWGTRVVYQPDAVCFDKDGNVYVLDAFSGILQIYVYTRENEYIKTIAADIGEMDLNTDCGIAVTDAGDIYITSPSNHAESGGVYKVEPDGSVSAVIGQGLFGRLCKSADGLGVIFVNTSFPVEPGDTAVSSDGVTALYRIEGGEIVDMAVFYPNFRIPSIPGGAVPPSVFFDITTRQGVVDIACYNGEYYVLTEMNVIVVFDADLRYVRTIRIKNGYWDDPEPLISHVEREKFSAGYLFCMDIDGKGDIYIIAFSDGYHMWGEQPERNLELRVYRRGGDE
ncbi:MAG: hypothetical protein FWG93_01850 [Oscillospiraceae bacterium]|nr:hypothetical protein [Oscillospiraceae bacterium]